MAETFEAMAADFRRSFPELAARARAAVLLRPEPDEAPPPEGTHLGGSFLWPANEMWPACAEHGTPHVAVVQIRARDVASVPFPPGRDLLQVTWCPRDHRQDAWGNLMVPDLRVSWRRDGDALEPFSAPPPVAAETHYVPRPCRLAPDATVDELPAEIELPEALREEVERWYDVRWSEADVEGVLDAWSFYGRLAPAVSSKAGGHPAWSQDPPRWGDDEAIRPRCPGGHEMEPILTISSGGGRELEATGIRFGRMGACFVFASVQCEGAALEVVHQN